MGVILEYTDMAGNRVSAAYDTVKTAQESARLLRDNFRRFRGHNTDFVLQDDTGNALFLCPCCTKGWDMKWVKVAQER